MNLTKFKDNVMSLMSYPNGDEKFAALRVYTHGMAPSRFAKALNFAASCVPEGEIYVEIGTFSGFTLLSAGYSNNTVCYGIDDLSVKDFFSPDRIEEAKNNVRKILLSNIHMFGGHNIKFIESDFRNVKFAPEVGKIGVLLIDGKHTEQEVRETLVWAEPYLADKCVIFFDDVVMENINRAICDLWKKGGELLYYAASTITPHDVTGFGVAIMAIQKAPK